MNGNLVRYEGQVHRVNTSTGEYVTLEGVFEIDEEEYIECYKNLEDGEIEDIPLSDEFFTSNRYKFDENADLFIAEDGFGPAIKRRSTLDYFCSDRVEYSVAGIVIRTVDEFQNLMNVIHCERIADKITV